MSSASVKQITRAYRAIGLVFALPYAHIASAQTTSTYTYDALGRLVNASESVTGGAQSSTSYTLDPAGNRTNLTVSGTGLGQPPGSGTGGSSIFRRAVVVPLNGYTVIPLP